MFLLFTIKELKETKDKDTKSRKLIKRISEEKVVRDYDQEERENYEITKTPERSPDNMDISNSP